MEVKKILSEENMLNPSIKKGRNHFFVSDNPEWFSGLARGSWAVR